MSSREIVLRESNWLRNGFLSIGLFSTPALVLLLPESSIWWLGLLLLGATNFWLLLFSESIQGCQWRCCLLEDGGKLKLTDYGGFWIRVNAEGFWQLGRCVVVYGGLPTSLSQSNKPWHLLFFYDNLTKSDFHYLMRFLKVKWVPR